MSNLTRPGVRIAAVGRRTWAALGVAATRWDTRAVFVLATVLYTIVYAVATDALALAGDPGLSVLVVADPLSRLWEPMGYLAYEPIARLETTWFTYLFSPIEAAIAIALAVLVAANAALTYLGLVQPKACGLSSSGGVLAGVPALFSGAACCGPVIFAVVGIQMTSTLLTAFRFLVPVAFVLLVLSLLAIGRHVEPNAV